MTTLGLYLSDAPLGWEQVDRWQRVLGPSFGVLSLYQAWGSEYRNFWKEPLLAAVQRGLSPMITWEPWRPQQPGERPSEQPDFSLAGIAGGEHDAYMQRWAEECRDFGHELLLRPMHEMNGDWYPWCGTVNGNSPAEYVRAWRHMRKVFERAGAGNVRWVWSPYVTSHPDTPGNRLEQYYPGADVVDWVALDGYNWGTFRAEFRWQGAVELFGPAIETMRRIAPGTPAMIAEVGCAEQGGNKAKWVAELFAALQDELRPVETVVWFNVDKERDWRIDSSGRSLMAFYDAARALRHGAAGGRSGSAPHRSPAEAAMNRRVSLPATLGLALALALPSGAVAQTTAYVFSSAEVGQDEVAMVSTGFSAFRAGAEWGPAGGVLAYWLRYPAGGGAELSRWAIAPSAGLRYQGQAGSVQGTLGYLWTSTEQVGGPSVPSAARQGLQTSLLADYLPSSAVRLQGIISYNAADRYLWTRLRGDHALRVEGQREVRGGLEVLAQGETEVSGREAYQALQVGPRLEVGSRKVRLGGSAGWKKVFGGAESGAYARVEMVWLP